jgi:hypothetical protein
VLHELLSLQCGSSWLPLQKAPVIKWMLGVWLNRMTNSSSDSSLRSVQGQEQRQRQQQQKQQPGMLPSLLAGEQLQM